MPEQDYRHSFDDATHRLDRHRDRIRERERVLADVAGIQIAFASADGTVKVTVDSDGLMLALEVSPTLNGVPAARIADKIMRVYTAAQRAAASRASELITSAFGDHPAVTARYRARLEPEISLPQKPAPRRPRAAPSHDDDDFDQASLYRG